MERSHNQEKRFQNWKFKRTFKNGVFKEVFKACIFLLAGINWSDDDWTVGCEENGPSAEPVLSAVHDADEEQYGEHQRHGRRSQPDPEGRLNWIITP